MDLPQEVGKTFCNFYNYFRFNLKCFRIIYNKYIMKIYTIMQYIIQSAQNYLLQKSGNKE